jgi:autotransporter translocation and assembly factor TamB
LLHACNFSFRGNSGEPARATASLWTELTGLTWRDRTAEAIMLGAALYNRQIQLEQLYIKQKTNQLTLSGEVSFPSNSSDWLSPDFRGDISASINHLGDFASLFGADPGAFAGKIAIEGAMNARDRKIGGHITASGTSLRFFRTSVDALNAKFNLKATELEFEQLELNRKSDFVRAQGKIDLSHKHSYSGTLNATIGNLAEYLSIFRGPGENNIKPAPADIQVRIDSSNWDARGTIGLPDSSSINFTARFPFPVGTNWNAFLTFPLNITLDFPSIFLANAPQFFHPAIFRDGILSGKLSLSDTLHHPRIVGDAQLLNGKLQNTSLNLTEASGRVTFDGIRASLDFFNAATKDLDLSFRGDIDFHDTNDLTVGLAASVPIFDLRPRRIDCVNKIEIESIVETLAPVVAELELRGGLFRSDWTMNLKEPMGIQSNGALSLKETARKFSLCLGTGTDDKTLVLGAHPRPELVKPRKPAKRR